MTAAERAERTRAADALCARALEIGLAGRDDAGIALVAVGGYGRGELAPYSDLDVVLVHDDAVEVSEVAATLWYPLWDAALALDHSVRRLSEATEAARDDPRVALGLLDARHLAGDPNLTLRLRTSLLPQWRREARRQLPLLREIVDRRTDRMGELAHASVPDLKESLGGLRDATVMKALVATWLVDVPHADLERCRGRLLDVRDVLHAVNGRGSDKIAPDAWPDLADALGLADAVSAQQQVRELGRRITHLARLTWRRVDAALARPAVKGARTPALERVARGVAVSSGEVVLQARTDPAADPLLLLRAAAEAAQRALALSPATAARLARDGVAVPEPWGIEARNLLVRLLAAGPGLLPVWETLDETGALTRILPEWERVRLLPHASVVHRFTVDRHLVETCIAASRLIRRVDRTDVLMAAALLHDIGKGGAQDHSVAGEPLAVAVAVRLGFDDRDAALVGRLVRRHLLLTDVATSRDLEDPMTVAYVAERVLDVQTLDLLEVLTEADARATAPKAWTTWREALVRDLASRVRAALLDDRPSAGRRHAGGRHVAVPERVRREPATVDVRLERSPHGSTLTVVSGDRVGLIADAAGALAAQRIPVRTARAWVQDDFGISVWEVADDDLDESIVRQRFDAVFAGRIDPMQRIGSWPAGGLGPSVLVRHDASRSATVLEVRVDDRPGVVYLVCRALAGLDVAVRSAHVTTLGPQAVDVFYVGEPGAEGLTDERVAAALHAVRGALTSAATLGT